VITLNVNVDSLISHFMSDSWLTRVRALSKAITLVENNPTFAQDFLKYIKDAQIKDLDSKSSNTSSSEKQKKTQVIGLTGFPGSGKSTIVNLLVKKFRAQNKKVAVLAVDPSSSLTGGAVLGDRIRMQEHFKDDSVFIRSMGARGALGGLSDATQGAIELIKFLEFDYIIIETVGIGQSESEIVKIADTVLLVLLPNTGDEVQFMKAGVIQLAHIYVINKVDLSDPYRMVQELEDNDPIAPNWKAPVVCMSAVNQEGLDNLLSHIENHKQIL